MRRWLPIALFLASPAFGHGASKGLHLHATPEHAAAGAEVTIDVDASKAMREVKVGFVGAEPVRVVPKVPAKRVTVVLRVPAGTMSAHAEAVTEDGRTVRATLLVAPQREASREAE
jgi:hypothetical protein